MEFYVIVRHGKRIDGAETREEAERLSMFYKRNGIKISVYVVWS